jgi:hypothetical protein
MTFELLDIFERKIEVEFKDDSYLVRDNGSVYRKRRSNYRKRPNDEKWTFGIQNKSSGYMHFGSHVAHRIVAFAFLGNPPSEKHVVDHIDTNRCNNRIENLRWVTRLENIILNPITLSRIISIYGSLDNFFENPHTYKNLDPNFEWMRTVSKEEAKNCREQLLRRAASDEFPKGGLLGEWVYRNRQKNPMLDDKNQDTVSLSLLAIQRKWKTPTEFPNCPSEIGLNPLEEYLSNLSKGASFSKSKYFNTLVEIVEKGESFLSVLTANQQEDALKPWALTKITFENGKFVHEAGGTFFVLNGAKKAHFKLLGIPFKGVSIDDYC